MSRYQKTTGAENAPLNLSTEILVRFGDHVQPLSIHLEEHWQETEKEDSTEQKSQVRRWLVKLAFELPEGCFHAHLSIIEDSLSADLWLNHPELYKKADARMSELRSDLEDQGIRVKSLTCQPGEPTEPSTSLQTSLIDIRT